MNSCLKESLLTSQNLVQILALDLSFTIHRYFKIKEYLTEIEEELNSFKVMTEVIKENKPELGKERRDYLKAVQSQVSDLVEEKKFSEFIAAIRGAFDDAVGKFIREVSDR